MTIPLIEIPQLNFLETVRQLLKIRSDYFKYVFAHPHPEKIPNPYQFESPEERLLFVHLGEKLKEQDKLQATYTEASKDCEHEFQIPPLVSQTCKKCGMLRVQDLET